jgi:DNA-binding LacI/PurR family transcriptional regulator
VAFLNVQPRHPGFAERGRTFASVAASRGLGVSMFVAEEGSDEEKLPWGSGSASRQAPLVEQWLQASPRPTGLFVPTDEQTFRLYQLLRERGIQPGEDVDIVSCDNQEVWLRHMTPRPASIDLNFQLIGEHAVEQLLLRISHPQRATGTRILVAPRLTEP